MNPYEKLEEKSFWAPAVGRRDPADVHDLWDPKWRIFRRHKIATYGSCFAQHIGRALCKRKFGWMQCEEPPVGLSAESQKQFNYRTFSSRTGNIYTASLLHQWVEWSLDISEPPQEIWEKDGRFIDPFRPNVEPGGFVSKQELLDSRSLTIDAFRKSFTEANIFVFTLGLTEAWVNAQGYEYPMCPGTIAGDFDEGKHEFKNYSFREIIKDVRRAVALIRTVNPRVKILMTVSPVPLTATMSGNHVLTATVESKSVLRAVAGELARRYRIFDYFPSYEIITSAPFQGMFYEENKRTVRQDGVDFVMESFFDCLDSKFKVGEREKSVRSRLQLDVGGFSEDVVCEEELLAAFAGKR